MQLVFCVCFFFAANKSVKASTVDTFGYFSLGICTSLWLSLSVNFNVNCVTHISKKEDRNSN